MKWNDVTSDKQSDWLADEVTQSFIARLAEEATAYRDGAVGFMRQDYGVSSQWSAAKYVGMMDAFLKAKLIAETMPEKKK